MARKPRLVTEGMKNDLPRAESIWAFFSLDEDGNEGLLAHGFSGIGMTPLVTANERLLPAFTKIAREISDLSGRHVVMAQFTNRIDKPLSDLQ